MAARTKKAASKKSKVKVGNVGRSVTALAPKELKKVKGGSGNTYKGQTTVNDGSINIAGSHQKGN